MSLNQPYKNKGREKWKADEIVNLKAAPKRPNPLNKEQTETKTMRETKGLDIEGDGSRLPEIPVQEPADARVRIFRIPRDPRENSVHRRMHRM